jgi:hypothetical protein
MSTDSPGSPDLQAGLAKLTIFNTYGTSLGLSQSFNHLEISGKASADRTVYQKSLLTDGTRTSNNDRNLDQYGALARVSYEIRTGVKPFVEVSAYARQHDLAVDRNGLQRDSQSLSPKIGTTFEINSRLNGEISAGYLMREYKDPSLPELRGIVADASLIWAVNGLTTATLIASSRGGETLLPGVSGVLQRDVEVQVDHAFRRWLIGTAKLGYGLDQYVGSNREDKRMSLAAAVTYKFTREFWLKGEYRHNRRQSSEPNGGYSADVFLIGLKLQR